MDSKINKSQKKALERTEEYRSFQFWLSPLNGSFKVDRISVTDLGAETEVHFQARSLDGEMVAFSATVTKRGTVYSPKFSFFKAATVASLDRLATKEA